MVIDKDKYDELLMMEAANHYGSNAIMQEFSDGYKRKVYPWSRLHGFEGMFKQSIVMYDNGIETLEVRVRDSDKDKRINAAWRAVIQHPEHPNGQYSAYLECLTNIFHKWGNENEASRYEAKHRVIWRELNK